MSLTFMEQPLRKRIEPPRKTNNAIIGLKQNKKAVAIVTASERKALVLSGSNSFE